MSASSRTGEERGIPFASGHQRKSLSKKPLGLRRCSNGAVHQSIKVLGKREELYSRIWVPTFQARIILHPAFGLLSRFKIDKAGFSERSGDVTHSAGYAYKKPSLFN